MKRDLSTFLLLVLFAGCGEDAGQAALVNNAEKNAEKNIVNNDVNNAINAGPMSEYPEWVCFANDTYTDDNGSAVILAVGVASSGRNPAMCWDAANNNALVKTCRILDTQVRAMMDFYAQEAGDFYNEGTLNRIRSDKQVSRMLAENFSSKAIPINKYLTPDRKEAYILMRLDLDNETLQSMSNEAKAALREHYATKDQSKTKEALTKMDPALKKLKKKLGDAPALPSAVR